MPNLGNHADSDWGRTGFAENLEREYLASGITALHPRAKSIGRQSGARLLPP